jgi:hypothetical protein
MTNVRKGEINPQRARQKRNQRKPRKIEKIRTLTMCPDMVDFSFTATVRN